MRYELGVIGAGNMAEAIVRAAVQRGMLAPGAILAADPSPQRRAVMAELGVEATDDNARVLAGARQVMLAIKPQALGAIAPQLAEHLRPEQVVISIMAGIGTAKLAQAIGRPSRVIRVMPNTPLMSGLGMTGIAPGPDAQAGDADLALRLFGAAGEAIKVREQLMDAVTAVSGSGPAYVFYLAEAMQQAAADLGLGEHARLLVTQTLRGAAELLAQSDEPAGELRRRVTSPGGTTEAAIRTLEAAGVKRAVVEAIKAAEARGRELGA